jgi:outer membrane protein assembly factor BamB
MPLSRWKLTSQLGQQYYATKPLMIASSIRELAAGRNTLQICAAFVEDTVQIWDLTTLRQFSQFEARFATGAKALAMHPNGTQIVTGASAPAGVVTAYAPTGSVLWERRGLAYPARLRFSPSGHYVYCTLDDQRVEKIDSQTGETFAVIKQARHIFEGPYGYSLIVSSARSAYVVKDDRRSAGAGFDIDKLTFAVLDVAFDPDRIYITESGGPLRCIDLGARGELWRFDPPKGSHFLRLYWSPMDEHLYGVLRHYEKGLFRHLIRFDRELGNTERVCHLESWEEAFVEKTHQMVTSAGDLIDLSNGLVVGKLAFPQREYQNVSV